MGLGMSLGLLSFIQILAMKSSDSQMGVVDIPDQINKITVGSYHSIAHSADGVWLFGQSHSSQGCASPQFIGLKTGSSAAGHHHSFVWSQHQVYCWGSNQDYQLGLQEEIQYEITKSQVLQQAIENGIKLREISCGDTHSIALFEEEDSEQSQLFAWGQSKNYQLALDTNAIVPYPVKIDCFDTGGARVTKIYSKSDYNVFVTEQGSCYSWGSNIFGRIGFPNSIKHNKIPTQIVGLSRVREVGIGMYHCVALTEAGQAYSWGHGMQGQLGIDKFVSEAGINPVVCQQPLKAVSCGEYHTIVLTHNNELMSCGSNASQALGHSQVDSKKRCRYLCPIPKQFAESEVVKIASGNRHNLVLLENGKVMSWGCNRHGQLGRNISHAVSAREESPFRLLCDSSPEQSIEKQSKQQMLKAWQQKYRRFKKEKEREQELLLEELNSILS